MRSLSIGAMAKRRGRSTALKLLNEPCMAELAPSFCMPACCLYNARQPQTLRQNQKKGEANVLKMLGVQTFSAASSMTLNRAAPPDQILTRSPAVTVCHGRDLAPRV